jgi:flagellar biosynthesis chaperone FliJ
MVDVPGPAVDAQGRAVIDPTANVIANLEAAVRRLDDLRDLNNKRIDDALVHAKETATLRASYDEKLREAETKRIDAIRAVDVGAVNRAAEVSAAQALTLATQVATSAETLRAQVATTAEANRVALATALNPVLESIADLRRIQYEQQGQKTATVETKEDRRGSWNTGANISAVFIGISAIVTALIIKGG